MKILVTGGAGYIGSNLIRQLVSLGHKVTSLDNYFTGYEQNHTEGATYIRGSTAEIKTIFKETFDMIYHLGEYSRVEQSFEDIEKVWDYNRLGTSEVLEFSRQNAGKLIYAGSSTKFGDGGMGRNQSPYAWSKASNTELVMNYGDWFDLDYAITYFYNVYGRNEISEGKYATVIAIFQELMRKGYPLNVVEPGTQKRNFTYIDDIVNGLICVGENGHGDNFGIGQNRSYELREVALLFGGEINYLPERMGNRMDALCDTARLRDLGWKPVTNLDDYISYIKKNNWDNNGFNCN